MMSRRGTVTNTGITPPNKRVLMTTFASDESPIFSANFHFKSRELTNIQADRLPTRNFHENCAKKRNARKLQQIKGQNKLNGSALIYTLWAEMRRELREFGNVRSSGWSTLRAGNIYQQVRVFQWDYWSTKSAAPSRTELTSDSVQISVKRHTL